MNCLNETPLLELFLEAVLAEKGLSKNTAAAYLNDLQGLLLYFNLKRQSILHLTHQDLNHYLSQPAFSQQKRNTKVRKISAIKQWYIFLLSEGLITHNPAADLQSPKRTQQLPKALSIEQIETLMRCAMDSHSDEGIRDACILQLLYSTGMRISEVLSLTLETLSQPVDVQEDHCILNITGKGNKQRLIVINHIALKTLHEYMSIRSLNTQLTGNPFVFASRNHSNKPKHLSRQMFFISLKCIAIKAGIDPDLVSPHKIRHSFASHILQNGANLKMVQEMLGHASISSTQIYTKILSEQAKELILKSHPLAQPQL